MRDYSIVMEGIATCLFLGLGVWFGLLARRVPGRTFRSVTAGAAIVFAFAAVVSVHHLLILVAHEPHALSGLGDPLLGLWGAVRATLAAAIGAGTVLLGLRYWSRLARAQRMVSVLTDRVPPEAHDRQAELSSREHEVLQLIRQGNLSDSQIATALHISTATAGTHVQNILRKTGLHNRRDLMLLRARPPQRQPKGA